MPTLNLHAILTRLLFDLGQNYFCFWLTPLSSKLNKVYLRLLKYSKWIAVVVFAVYAIMTLRAVSDATPFTKIVWNFQTEKAQIINVFIDRVETIWNCHLLIIISISFGGFGFLRQTTRRGRRKTAFKWSFRTATCPCLFLRVRVCVYMWECVCLCV